LELYRNLEIKPQVLFIDGQGILHPEKIGLASHVGVLLDIVTVGIAKSRLVGELRKEPEEGEFVPIYHKGKISGYCYCVKKRKKFLWISPGNLITPYKALKLSIKLIKGGKHILLYRADKLSKRF
jgi:deoxyribonuclease V